MSTKWRRFEVMLPRQFNDGRDVPPEWISLAVLEIGDHFGSVSYETQIIEGRWQQAGVVENRNRNVPNPPQSPNHEDTLDNIPESHARDEAAYRRLKDAIAHTYP